MEGQELDTTEAWRALRRQQQADRRARARADLEELRALEAAGELERVVELNRELHVRVYLGRQVVDLWPTTGKWRVFGEKGRARLGGLGGALRYLGVRRPGRRPR